MFPGHPQCWLPQLCPSSWADRSVAQANAPLAPAVASLGYVGKLFDALWTRGDGGVGLGEPRRADLVGAVTKVVLELSKCDECVRAMRALDCVTPLIEAPT